MNGKSANAPSPADYTLETMQRADHERLIAALAGYRLVQAGYRTYPFTLPPTCCRSADGQSYLTGVNPEDVMTSAEHFVLVRDNVTYMARSRGAMDPVLSLLNFPASQEAQRAEVEAHFIAALQVFGRCGAGQDGRMNTTDEISVIDHYLPHFATRA